MKFRWTQVALIVVGATVGHRLMLAWQLADGDLGMTFHYALELRIWPYVGWLCTLILLDERTRRLERINEVLDRMRNIISAGRPRP